MTPNERAVEAVARALHKFGDEVLTDYDVAPDVPRNDPDFSDACATEAATVIAQITPLLTGPLQAQLADPVAVHANMLRGTIAKPSIEQIIHLYGRDALMRAMDAEKMAALTKEFPNV